MATVHSLLVGNSETPSLDKYGCFAGTYRVMGTNLTEGVVSGIITDAPFVFPLANATQNRLYVKRYSGEVWSYDLDTFSDPQFIGELGFRGNFLIDENIAAIYGLNHFGDLVRVNIQQGSPNTATILAPGINQGSIALFSGDPVLQWRRLPTSTQTSEICIQVSSGGFTFPATQSILRFDPQTAVLLPPLVSQTAAAAPNGIQPSNCFAFGPDGFLYVVKAFVSLGLPPQVWRFDGTTGEFKDVFVSQGIPENPTQILFAPDGKSLLLMVGDNILQFDLTGAVIGTIPLTHQRPGYSTLVAQKVGPTPGRDLKPTYSYLISILAGVVGDNSGWVRRPGRPWPEPWPGWELVAEKVWNSLSAAERDVVVALGIHELALLMAEPNVHREVWRILNAALSEQSRHRLSALLKMHGYDD